MRPDNPNRGAFPLQLCHRRAARLEPRQFERTLLDHVNVDFWSGAIYQLHGIPMDLYVPIFALGRVPGWVVQCLEQKRENILIRPLTTYDGPPPRAYVPIDQR